jgi:hypothetical protein
MSDRERRESAGAASAAKSKGGHRDTDKIDARQQEIIHTFRQRQQSNFFRSLIDALKSIFGQ